MNKPRFVRSSVIGKFMNKHRNLFPIYRTDYHEVVGGTRKALQPKSSQQRCSPSSLMTKLRTEWCAHRLDLFRPFSAASGAPSSTPFYSATLCVSGERNFGNRRALTGVRPLNRSADIFVTFKNSTLYAVFCEITFSCKPQDALVALHNVCGTWIQEWNGSSNASI